jgi:hypothetical protein
MFSPRRTAQLGLFAAAVVLVSSMSVLLAGSRNMRPPQAGRVVPAVKPVLAAHQGQVVLSDHRLSPLSK